MKKTMHSVAHNLALASVLAFILMLVPGNAIAVTLEEALDTTNLTWTTGGDASWFGQTTNTRDFVDAAQSGAIDNNQETWIQTSVTGPGTLSFWWSVSSQSNQHYLEFWTNGVLVTRISGTIANPVGWQWQDYALPEGIQLLRWRYVKNWVASSGQDRGCLDEVTFSPSGGKPLILTHPTNQTVVLGTKVMFTVAAIGTPPLSYQWRFYGTNLPGQTNTTLTLAGVTTNQAGLYKVVVTNVHGSVTSKQAALEVKLPMIHYVNATNPAPVWPYVSWANAATNIQQAVDAALAGETVLVTNGIYNCGGRTVYFMMSNRVVIDKAVTVQSINGPAVTLIVGQGTGGSTNCGDGAIRCVYVGSNAVLSGFTLTNGHTMIGGDYEECCGGGALCEIGGGGVLNNCVLTGNSADWEGGGAYSGTLNNCVLTGNSATYGGGSCGWYEDTLNNCTLTGNWAEYGGGSSGSTLSNCIVYYNNAANGSNYYNGSFSFSCSAPLPSGKGNITGDPMFASPSHLSAMSPCIGAGSASCATGVDIDGEPWQNPPCMGADQYVAGADTGPVIMGITASHTNVVTDLVVDLTAQIQGRLSQSVWDFGDGTVVSNRLCIGHAWSSPGNYMVRLTGYNQDNSDGVSATLLVRVGVQEVHYVDAGSATPAFPYTNWATAAQTIQDAVDAGTQLGRLVLVTNGVYATGGKAVHGTMTNRLVIHNDTTVQSVNGPAVTLIVGSGVGNGGTNCGDGAIRCVYVGNDAVLSGFTLTNGYTRTTGNYEEQSGGGAWCEVSGVVSNCVLTSNSADECGGGSYSGTLKNCTLIGNSAGYGGGSYSGTMNNCALIGNLAEYGGGSFYSALNNCTLTGNSAEHGGGSYDGTLNNCILYYNAAANGANYSGSAFTYSCTTPLPSGVGNISSDPLFAWASHLSALSPCIGAGSASYATGVDIDGEPWQNPPCMGADQYVAGADTGPVGMAITASHTNLAVGFAADFTAQTQGRLSKSVWDFGDGTVVSNRLCIGHAWSTPGNYLVRLTGYNQDNPDGVSATTMVRVGVQQVHYVDVGSATPAFPYTNWATAAQTIQDAVDAGTQVGRLVLVTNGVYAIGGKAVHGTMTNRLAIDKDTAVQSVNGPAVTLIVGQGVGGSTNCGNGAIRCVYVGTNAVLSGFTLTNGHTRTSGDPYREGAGGGVWCEVGGMISNCVLIGNSAGYGGGSYNGTLNNCVLIGNSAGHGGGSYSGTLNNCTLTGNSAYSGGGSCYSMLANCIVHFNTASSGFNYSYSSLSYSSTAPLPVGSGNITNEPLFVNWLEGDLRLLPGSPCIGAGNDRIVQSGSLDLDGKPRIVGAHVDMGAFEYQFVPPAFAGLVQVTNTVAQGGSASVSVPLHPNANPTSFLWYLNGTTLLPDQTTSNLVLNPVKLNDAGVYSVVVSNAWGSITGAVMTLRVTFQIDESVCSLVDTNFSLAVQMEANRAYWLEMRTNLTEGNWQVVAGLTNHAGWATLVDTNACDRQRFYRVGVK